MILNQKSIFKASLICLLAVANPKIGFSHEGHDHGATNKNIELKPTLNLNQKISVSKNALNGIVINDPNFTAVVQSPNDGKISFKSLYLGKFVKKGTVLAEIQTVTLPSDLIQINGTIADLNSKIRNTQANLNRLKNLNGFISPRQIESLEIELSGYQNQKKQLSKINQQKIVLTSPINGVINKLNISQGQIVSSKEILIEIIQPNQLLIEVANYNYPTEILQKIRQAKTSTNSILNLSGFRVLPTLRNQAQIIQYHIDFKDNNLNVSIGQPVQLIIN